MGGQEENKKVERMKSSDVINLLRIKYPKDMGFVFLEQVANKNGFVNRYADAIVMNVWQSRFQIIGIEVKVSRSDWLAELKKPDKADVIFQYCDLWYVATPEGIIKPGELPPTWGHLECKDKVYVRAESARNDHRRLDDAFVSSIIRRFMEQATPAADLERQLRDAESRGFEQGKSALNFDCECQKKELERLRKFVADFQNASGVDLREGWHNAEQIGHAVQMVLNGKHMKVRSWLMQARETIDDILKEGT